MVYIYEGYIITTEQDAAAVESIVRVVPVDGGAALTDEQVALFVGIEDTGAAYAALLQRAQDAEAELFSGAPHDRSEPTPDEFVWAYDGVA